MIRLAARLVRNGRVRSFPDNTNGQQVSFSHPAARADAVEVRRHAHARHVIVLLRWVGGRVEIIVSDDGNGLRQDEVEEIGGTFIIQSARGEGTRIIARLPLAGGRT